MPDNVEPPGDDGFMDRDNFMLPADFDFDEQWCRELFLERLRDGIPPLHAALEVRWTPAKMRTAMAEPEFAAVVAEVMEYADQTIEKVLHRMARRGNMDAVKMWLFNRQPGRWKDVKRIETSGGITIDVNVVDATKTAVLAHLRGDRGLGDPTKAIEAPIIDAEVIEDGDESAGPVLDG